MDRRLLLRRLAFVFGAIGVVLLAWYTFALPKTLRVAVGPPDSAQHRFMLAIARALKDTQQSYKLEVIPVQNSVAAATALDRHKVDLAVLRSDDSSSNEARALAIIQRRQIVVLARNGSDIASVGHLKGRSVALVNIGAESNRAIFDAILAHYEVAPHELTVQEIEMASVPAAPRHDAYVILDNPASDLPRFVMDLLAKQSGQPVTLVGMTGPEGLALRMREVGKSSIPAGAFGGTPPVPAEAVSTVAVTYELVATTDLSQTDGNQLLSAMLEARTRVRRLLPRTTFDLEAPPTEEQRRFLPHAGAAAFAKDEDAESFLETYSDQIWLALFGLSIVGSTIAGFLGWTGQSDPRPTNGNGVEERLRGLAARIEAAEDAETIETIRIELDDIALALLKDGGGANGGIGDGDAALWLSTLSAVIERRRLRIAAHQKPENTSARDATVVS